jgi:hypothetical protein
VTPPGAGRNLAALALLAVLVNLPLVHSVAVDHRVDSRVALGITVVADLMLLVVAGLFWRFGRRPHDELRLSALRDVERPPPGATSARVELHPDGTADAVGEVVERSASHVVLDCGGRRVHVALDGHANPVGHQQPAGVHGRVTSMG